MYRHELRFVLRFGVRERFNDFAHRLYEAERARGWAAPRIWQAVSGHVNEIVIDHDYESVEAFREERAAFHAEPGEVGEILARLAELAVPGTAVQFDLDGFDL
jgi:hypothetical protein